MKNLPLTLLTLTVLFTATLSAQTTLQLSASERQSTFLLEDGVAIQGYDPVSYFEGKPTKGKKDITTTYEGVTYRFASEANKQTFLASPAKYEPAYGGWCAWAMAESGDKVEIDPRSYKIVEGRLFLFYNGFWANTRKQWQAEAKKGKEAQLLHQADQNWADAVK